MTSTQQKQAVQSSVLDTVLDLLAGDGWGQAERQKALEIFGEIEAQLVELVFLPPERVARVQHSLEAQLLGLIELARLEALSARRELILQGISTAIGLARRILLKL